MTDFWAALAFSEQVCTTMPLVTGWRRPAAPWAPFHFNQAHAAVGRDGQFLVVAEMRHVKPDLLGRMHHHAAFGHFDFIAVDG